MASLSLYKNQLLLAVNREVLLVNSSSGGSAPTRLFLTLPAPELPTKKGNGALQANEDATVEPDGEEEQQVDPHSNDSNRILHTAVSNDEHLLAIATAGEKALYLYRLDDGAQPKLLSRRDLSRTSNAIRFGRKGVLFVADKTGDCFTYECLGEDASAPSKWILAHFSMVLDILPTPLDDFILTCDRDEKIRCTQFPKSNLIESYCLGHTEYVAAIALLPTQSDELLVSVSGDKTLRIWKYITGTQLVSVPLPAAALKMAIRKIGNVSHVAVTLFEHDETLIVYEIRSEADGFVCNRLSGHSLPDAQDVSSILFDGSGRLIVALVSTKGTVRIDSFSLDANVGAYVREDGVEALNEGVAQVAASLTVPFEAEEIGLLFKKKFDNIIDYHERKKRRIEEKTKTKGI